MYIVKIRKLYFNLLYLGICCDHVFDNMFIAERCISYWMLSIDNQPLVDSKIKTS
jgi:hypothetical protein